MELGRMDASCSTTTAGAGEGDEGGEGGEGWDALQGEPVSRGLTRCELKRDALVLRALCQLNRQ